MTVVKAVRGFFAFWYDFIVGDDWTVAASIAAALLVTFLLQRAHLVAWWVMPVTVIVIVGVSLRRASPKPAAQAPKPPEAKSP